MLLNSTIRALWRQFKAVERPFLVRDPRQAKVMKRADLWGDDDDGSDDLDEKGVENEVRRISCWLISLVSVLSSITMSRGPFFQD
jgi:hypothetical protein